VETVKPISAFGLRVVTFVEGPIVAIEPGLVSTFGHSVRAFHARAYSENRGVSKA